MRTGARENFERWGAGVQGSMPPFKGGEALGVAAGRGEESGPPRADVEAAEGGPALQDGHHRVPRGRRQPPVP